MSSYRLGDADRERFGAPEWMPLELLDVTIDEITELSNRFSFELEDWPDVFYGQGRFEVDAKSRPPKWQIQTAVWLALRQSDIKVEWPEVGSIALLRVTWRRDDEQGKDDGSDSSDSPPSPTPETSTTPPSSTSSPDSAELTLPV